MLQQCSNNRRIVVHAGPHERINAFVPMVWGEDFACKGVNVREVNADGTPGASIPSQLITSCSYPFIGGGQSELVVYFEHLSAHEEVELAISPAEEVSPANVQINVQKGQQADIIVGEELFTSYVVKPGIARPFCYPINGPDGINIARDIVYLPEGEFGCNYGGKDHVHHKGIWVAQGDVNGVDNWSELEGHGYTVNKSLEAESQGKLFAQLHANSDWTDASGKQILEEDTFIRVYNTPGSARIMDVTTLWSASYGGVFFGDTKEAGTLSIRLQETMEEREGGTIVNAYGAIGEAETWGKSAPWVDYYGPCQGKTCGVTLMDHPTNLRYPATWHVRSYGLFTANQWGLHDFANDHSIRGDYALPAGQALCFRFRVYVHEHDTANADVAAHYIDWIFPPQANIVAAEDLHPTS